MREFLESRFVRSLVHPAVTASRFGARLLGRGLERILKLIERVAGRGFLDDISEFLTAVDGLSLGFDERSKRVEEFLLGDDSSFVLVCGGQARANRSALEFLARLEDFRVPLVAVVANRLRPWPIDRAPRADDYARTRPGVATDAKRLSEAAGDADAGDEIVERLAEYAEGCASQNRGLREIEAASAARGIACLRIRELAGDIDHLAGLAEIGAMLALDARPVSPPAAPGGSTHSSPSSR
jgi:anion-transporting  ArsA/GET3 family ATPase